jgi:D-aspartate ligase
MIKNNTPVVVLCCELGALSIMRTLGKLGIKVYGVDSNPKAPALFSKYCRKFYHVAFNEDEPEAYIAKVLDIGTQLGNHAILIPTSDELAVLVAKYRSVLQKNFIFPDMDYELMRVLISKREMNQLATDHGVPIAQTQFPQDLDDVLEVMDDIHFPIMLKGIHGNRLYEQTGKKMVIVQNKDELLHYYNLLEDPAAPNLMIQELIPGDDDQVYIFDGYFNRNSDCLLGFTGHKVRQYPVHVGCASLGECQWHQQVADMTTAFMKNIGYKGVLDIGYRYDPRDGKYKVLDINPRVGQAFRIFVDKSNMDVVRALYLDLTGQIVEQKPPRNGRRWIIEDYDLISTYDYFNEGTLKIGQWLRSFKNLEEGAWFDIQDMKPFMRMSNNLLLRILGWAGKRLKALVS